jgi:putative phosphoesterase
VSKIAVITDTHANLPALEAALAAINALGCEAIYHTGDVVGAGPFPAEVLDRLLHTPGIHLVMGNHDELCAFGIPDPRPGWMDDKLAANTAWTRAQVGPEVRDVMATWPYEIVETFFGRQIAFLHYPLDVNGGGFASIIPDPSAGDLDELFVAVQADVIFYGHHHPAADHAGRARYINPGSLGCGPEAVARFTVVDVDHAGRVTFQHHTAPYDRSGLHEALARRDLPDHEFLRQAFFP